MNPNTELRELGRLVRGAREAAGFSQQDFANALGLSQSQLSKIEMGKYTPKPRVIRELSRTFGLDATRLRALVLKARGWEDVASPRVGRTRGEGLLPVVGRAACGTWMEALADGREPTGEPRLAETPRDASFRLRDKKNAFWVVAQGDSMTGWHARIEEGDLLLVEPGAPLVDGKIALVQLDGKVTVKEWHAAGNVIVLLPTNPDYPSLTLSKREFEERGGRAFRITYLRPHPRPL